MLIFIVIELAGRLSHSKVKLNVIQLKFGLEVFEFKDTSFDRTRYADFNAHSNFTHRLI